MSEIVELLDSSAIALDHEADDWREAIRFAGSLILDPPMSMLGLGRN